MATLTYTQATKVLQFDLSDNEAAIVDTVMASPKGFVLIEGAMNEFFRQQRQRRRDNEIEQIREKVQTITDTKRQAIMTILNS